MTRPIITLTTDFGPSSPYVAQMKGVILSLNAEVRLVDLSHAVAPQDVLGGAFVLADVTPLFPTDTIHLAVIDPGVGSARKIVYARIGSQQYVAPDNGLLSVLAARQAPSTIVALGEPRYWRPEPSTTFHGRDIMAPAAAWLSEGVAPTDLGPPCEGLTALEIPEARVLAEKIEGEVVSIDSFGNLVTNITAQMLAEVPTDDQVTIRCDDHVTQGIFQTYSDQPPMTLIALIGSSEKLELAIVNDSAKIMLGIRGGEKVTISW